ncbi:MAG: TIGR04076 family protein [Candidatus Thorarchaeota archaeon]
MASRNLSEKESILRLRDSQQEVVSFRVTIIEDGNCRASHKVGQKFEFSWNSPEGICMESLVGMYPILHSMRVFGDMRELGSPERNMRVYNCPSREIKFKIEALYNCNICGDQLKVHKDGVQSHKLQCTKPEFPLRVCENCYSKYKDKTIEW